MQLPEYKGITENCIVQENQYVGPKQKNGDPFFLREGDPWPRP